jgi:hypothetical protein
MLLFEGSGLTYCLIVRIITASSVVYHMKRHQSSVQISSSVEGRTHSILGARAPNKCENDGANLESQASQRKGVAEACKACSA